jgi:hypothetical protein
MNIAIMSHFSSNPNFTHGVTREVAKPKCVMVPQIKQLQVVTTNNPHYAIESEFLQLQVKICAIDKPHMGTSQQIT